ncbi:phosphatase PAP2 family protein [soil metagenome]
MTDDSPLLQESAAPAGVRHPPFLLWAIAAGAAVIALVLLAGLAVGTPFDSDRAILLGLRVPGHIGTPIGPDWLRRAMIDITALGSATVLTCVVVAVAGLLGARGLWLSAALVVAASATGSMSVSVLKGYIGRPRPNIVPHLVDAGGLSFPSGHSTSSAIVYLTVALLVTQVTRGRLVRNYIIACTILLVTAIGVSRVYLGVHWPSDVLAGWSFGSLWALAWWWVGARARASLAE